MNLIHLILMLERQGINVQSAFGTDFSEKLIDAAKFEAKKYLSEDQQRKVTFCVAKNESLTLDLASQLNVDRNDLLESFDLILGVNTSRYCHRLNKEMEYAKNIEDLLMKGGVGIIIDMNNRFPFFRSRMGLRSSKKSTGEYYLPSLEEYARPFMKRGFEILKMKNFCWIPHSAGPYLTKFCRVMVPILNVLAPGYAMRSLVIVRKI
jgi:hypothetical protein